MINSCLLRKKTFGKDESKSARLTLATPINTKSNTKVSSGSNATLSAWKVMEVVPPGLRGRKTKLWPILNSSSEAVSVEVSNINSIIYFYYYKNTCSFPIVVNGHPKLCIRWTLEVCKWNIIRKLGLWSSEGIWAKAVHCKLKNNTRATTNQIIICWLWSCIWWKYTARPCIYTHTHKHTNILPCMALCA